MYIVIVWRSAFQLRGLLSVLPHEAPRDSLPLPQPLVGENTHALLLFSHIDLLLESLDAGGDAWRLC